MGNENTPDLFFADNTNPDDIVLSYKVELTDQNMNIYTETVSRTRSLLPSGPHPVIFENANLIDGGNQEVGSYHRYPECWNKDQLTSRHAVKDRQGPVQGEDLLRPFANGTGSVDGLRTIVDFTSQIDTFDAATQTYIDGGSGVGPDGTASFPPVFTPTCFSSASAYN